MLPGLGKKTLSQLKPLELIIQGEFIWSYGGHEPKLPITSVLNNLASNYYFIGYTGDRSVETNLLTMLLNMYDYNHQNGTHRDLFRITNIEFHQFIDDGHHSQASRLLNSIMKWEWIGCDGILRASLLLWNLTFPGSKRSRLAQLL